MLTPEQYNEIQPLLAEVRKTKFDNTVPLIYTPADLSFYSDGRRHDVGKPGMIGGFIGEEKSGKSFVLGQVAASFLTNGQEKLNFEYKGPGELIWFDTEQSEEFYKLNQSRIHLSAGLKSVNSPRYSAYNLRKWTPGQRMNAIEGMLMDHPGTKIAVIDGLVDIVSDYNDLKESNAAFGKIMEWSYELKILVLTVIHVNKGDGKIRGHLGSELKNKCDFLIKVAQTERNQYVLSNPTGRYPTFPAMDFTRNEDSGLAEYTSGKEKLKLDF